MNLHKRNFFPKEFTVKSLRPWDNFFWWVETDKPKEVSVILPAEWGESRPGEDAATGRNEGQHAGANGVSVTSGSCGKVTVWLSPEI